MREKQREMVAAQIAYGYCIVEPSNRPRIT